MKRKTAISSPKDPPDGLLILPYGGKLDGGGFVVVWPDGHEITLDLSPVWAELIFLMNEALWADQKRPPTTRGWRAPETIVAALRYWVEVETLRRSVSNINRCFRRQATKQAPHLDVRPLLGTKRKVGIRLNWLLELDVPRVGEIERPAPVSPNGGAGKSWKGKQRSRCKKRNRAPSHPEPKRTRRRPGTD